MATAVYPAGKPNLVQQFLIVDKAAQAHHVDPRVLWGIYGAESGFGKSGNWFGIISAPRTGTFAGDANLAAASLAADVKKGGGYEQGLRIYSNQSYGLQHIKDVLRSNPDVFQGGLDPNQLPGVKQVEGAANATANAASDVGSALSGFFNLITSLEFWLRIGEGIVGLILIAMGLKSLGVSTPNIPRPPLGA